MADVRRAMAPAAATFYGNPTATLDLVGVTGTNGKTTTAYLVRSLLEADGRQTGLLGTVKSVIGGAEFEVERTTPEAIDLQRSFRAMLDGGDVACVMEVSSHALELAARRRLAVRRRGLHEPDAGPPRLPSDDGGLLPGQAQAVHRRRRSPCGPEPRRPLRRPPGHGSRDRRTDHVRARPRRRDLPRRRSAHGPLRVALHPALARRRRRAQLTAARDASTSTTCWRAFAAARALGVPFDTAVAAIEHAGQVPGRFETVDEGQPFAVLVDYAHTPDSLENVLAAARELTEHTPARRLRLRRRP